MKVRGYRERQLTGTDLSGFGGCARPPVIIAGLCQRPVGLRSAHPLKEPRDEQQMPAMPSLHGMLALLSVPIGNVGGGRYIRGFHDSAPMGCRA